MQRTNKNKNSGGNQMSLKKKTTKRLALFTSSSFVAASLSVAVAGGVALTPRDAAAQAVCTPPPSSGGGTNSVTYNAGTYNPGITCTAAGGTMTVATAGAITVSTTAGDTGDASDNGINLIGGVNGVTWNSTAGTVQGGAETNGPIIDVVTTTGAINITTGAVNRRTSPFAERGETITSGIRANSTTGAINITAGGVNINASPAGTSAIEATSSGGSITVSNTGSLQGRLRGILAQTSGTGTITLNIDGNVSANFTEGVAAIDTVAGSGATNINITAGTVTGNSGAAIRSVSASTAATAVNIQNTGGTVNGRVDFSGVTGSRVLFNNTGSTATGGRWTASGASVFTGFDDTINMAGLALNTAADGTTIDFGAGTDTLNMSSRLVVNGEVTLTNLEAFNNSGVIYFGGTSGTATDSAADDVLRMAGGTFTGSGDSRIAVDVFLGAETQAGCETLTGAGDCLDLRGGSTAGSTAGATLVTVTNLALGNTFGENEIALGEYNPVGVTVVDVGSGVSAAGHFVLDPNSVDYAEDPAYGGIISRPGLFAFALRYDAANQRHVFVGVPRTATMEYAMLPGAARSVWYMTSQAITDRQGDLRGGTQGTVWLRARGEYSKRDISTELAVFDDTLAFDNSYKLYAGTIIGGMDLISGTSGGYDYVLGAQLGYVGSSFDLDAAESSGRMTGATGGVYGSVWTPRFFLDTTFNTNFLTLDYDAPAFGSKTNTWLRSVGAQAEAGMRYMLGERMYVEPLAAAAFVYTTFEEVSLFGGEIRPDDAQSRRAALGLRVGADYPGQSVNWSYFLTGRAWNEFDGESVVVVNNPGDDLVYGDDFSGTFSEFEAGLSLANDAGTLSGFVTTGVKAQDGYSAVDLSTGLRLRW